MPHEDRAGTFAVICQQGGPAWRIGAYCERAFLMGCAGARIHERPGGKSNHVPAIECRFQRTRPVSAQENQYALASERDRFLSALDGDDPSVTARLAAHLTGCGNPLPSSTCRELGLPVGSSYGIAARQVMRCNGLIRPDVAPQATETAPESQAMQDPVADDRKVTMT